MFTVTIETDGPTFFDGESEFVGPQLAQILRGLADRVEPGLPTGDSATLFDDQGRSVGSWAYDAEDA